MQSFDSLMKKFNKWDIIFYSLAIIILYLVIKNYNKSNIENFEDNNRQFTTKNTDQLYDQFYANRYDKLLFSKIKNDYEIGIIVNNTNISKKSYILDIGTGTGHHVNLLALKGYNAIGIDKSKAMIEKANNLYPNLNYKQGDALDNMLFNDKTFTHITCLYFTIYYIKNKKQFFQNCYKWLMPGGYLVIHLVDRAKFDPIVPASDPIKFVSPQNYVKKRITNSVVKFNDFTYKANFNYLPKEDLGIMKETFSNQNTIRQQEHKLYMPTQKEILNIAMSSGFILLKKLEMTKVKYENQFIYVLQKPN